MLESFEVIKDNYEDNEISISELIGKMFKIDAEIATDMWGYILKKHESFLKYDSFFLTESVLYNAEKRIGIAGLNDIIKNNYNITKACFGKSEDVSFSAFGLIYRLIIDYDLDKANELLSLIENNKNKSSSIYEALDYIITLFLEEEKEMTGDSFSLLNSWIDKIKSKEQLAKINIKMLEFM